MKTLKESLYTTGCAAATIFVLFGPYSSNCENLKTLQQKEEIDYKNPGTVNKVLLTFGIGLPLAAGVGLTYYLRKLDKNGEYKRKK